MDVELVTYSQDSVSRFPDVKITISSDPTTQDFKNYNESNVNSHQPQLTDSQAIESPDEKVYREMTASCIKSVSLNVESEPRGLSDRPANKPADDEFIITPAGCIEDLPDKSNFENHNPDTQIQSFEDDKSHGAHKERADLFPDVALEAPPSLPTESLDAIKYSPRRDRPSSQENKALSRALAQQTSKLGHTNKQQHLPCSIAETTFASNLQTPIVEEFIEFEDPLSSSRQEITLNNNIIMTKEYLSEDMRNLSTPLRSYVGKAAHIVTSRIDTEAQLKTTNPENLTLNAQEILSDSQSLRKRSTADHPDSESKELRRSSTPGHNTLEEAPRLPEHHQPDVPETDNHGFESTAFASTIPMESTRTATHNTSNPIVKQPSPATPKGGDEGRLLAVAPQASPRTPSIPNKEALAAELKSMRIASITTRNTALAAEVERTRAILASRTQELRAPAADTVRMHIELLHAYNEIRDVGQGLIGMLAEKQGVRIGSLYENFGVGIKD